MDVTKALLMCAFAFALMLYLITIISIRGMNYEALSPTENADKWPQRRAQNTMDIWNRNKIDYNAGLRKEFDQLYQNKADADDEDLVKFVMKIIDPPSKHPRRRLIRHIFQTPQALAVDKVYHGQTGLFFIEAGALDGEQASNTVWLEAERNWTGLLVEADPFLYTQLRGKARTSYSINACLSGRVEKLSFQEHSDVQENAIQKNPSLTKGLTRVPCFSLETLMLALNRTTIDYFSLDIEGHEYDVLNAIPWTKLNITLLSIEYANSRGAEPQQAIKQLDAYMTQRGYQDIGKFEERNVIQEVWSRDIMFVKI